jgi:hypothetical protein
MWVWFFANAGSPEPSKIKPSSQRKPEGGDGAAEEEEEEEEKEKSEFAAVLRQMGPWLTSFLFHLALVILALLLVWMVWDPGDDEDIPIVPSAQLSENPGGLSDTEDTEKKNEQQVKEVDSTDKATEDSVEDLVSNTQSELITIGAAGGGGGGKLAPFGTATGTGTGIAAGFFGNGGNAKKVIYVIDASGSLVDTMPFVLLELSRSISMLNSEQEFNVIFFQDGTPIEVPVPKKGWKFGTGAAKTAVQNWIDLKAGNVSPRGRTDPRRAIKLAMNYQPELVFLLSDNILGSGRFEINKEELVGFFKSIKHKVAINTIQFLKRDSVLEEIAKMKGGVPVFVAEKDLGKRRRR